MPSCTHCARPGATPFICLASGQPCTYQARWWSLGVPLLCGRAACFGRAWSWAAGQHPFVCSLDLASLPALNFASAGQPGPVLQRGGPPHRPAGGRRWLLPEARHQGRADVPGGALLGGHHLNLPLPGWVAAEPALLSCAERNTLCMGRLRLELWCSLIQLPLTALALVGACTPALCSCLQLHWSHRWPPRHPRVAPCVAAILQHPGARQLAGRRRAASALAKPGYARSLCSVRM